MDISLTELNVYNLLITPFFLASKIFIDQFSKLSFLDILFITDFTGLNNSMQLYDYLLWELSYLINIKYLSMQFLFYTDYQDFLFLILYYSPELILALIDWLEIYWNSAIFNYTAAAWTDMFNDTLNSTVSELTEYLLLLIYYFWFAVLFLNIFRVNNWSAVNDIFFIRFLHYFYSMSKDMRFQFDATIQLIFFIFFYWTMAVATFDDDNEEFLELFSVGLFYFFIFVLLYFLYRYSKHYFAFLEASLAEGKTLQFILKQFVRDVTGTFGLLLRFSLLLFRANVYDTLDDCLDTYYIFLGDFDEDEAFDFSFFSLFNLLFYDADVNDDRIYSLEEENEFFFDLFNLYFMLWGKFFFFCFFILEEIFRLLLAFYIIYLIIFDVHAVNCSYVEDTYFINKRVNSTLAPKFTYFTF